MDPVLQSLIRLQELTLEQARLQNTLDSIPKEIETIDRTFQEASGSLQAAKTAVEESRKRRRALESELQDLEAKRSKYNDQLMQVKTNEEYRAMQKEIDGVKATIGTHEEKILLLMDEIESLQKKVAAEEAQLEGKKKDSEARKAVVRGQQDSLSAENAKLKASIDQVRSTLKADAIELFERIASLRNGIAVARALDERCQECKVRLRPQMFSEIRRNERILQCDSCKRVLYYLPPADPAGAPAPDAAGGAGDAKADVPT